MEQPQTQEQQLAVDDSQQQPQTQQQQHEDASAAVDNWESQTMWMEYLRSVQERTWPDEALFQQFLDSARQFLDPTSTPLDNQQSIQRAVRILFPFSDLVFRLCTFLPQGYGVHLGHDSYVLVCPDGSQVDVGFDAQFHGRHHQQQQQQQQVQQPPKIAEASAGGLGAYQQPIHVFAQQTTQVTQQVAGQYYAPAQYDPSHPPTIQDAHVFLRYVKERTEQANQPLLYRKFKDLIRKHRTLKMPSCEISKEAAVLLKDYADILMTFNRFLAPGDQLAMDANGTINVGGGHSLAHITTQ